jgi:hypothetical protein
MKSMKTEKLLRIWIENDRDSYSEESFKIIEDVLAKRKVKLPSLEELKYCPICMKRTEINQKICKCGYNYMEEPEQATMEFTESELQRWLWLRAVEWSNWPSFLAQPLAPILFIFFWWPYVLSGILVLDILWAYVRYSYANPRLANTGANLVAWLKWPAAIGAAIYLFIQGRYITGILALIWPLLAGFVCIPAKVGQIELSFAKKVGYVDKDAEL